MICVLGAGPHGRQLASLYDGELYDDFLPGHRPIREAAGPWLIGAAWPKVRRHIAGIASGHPVDDGVVVFPRASIGCDVTIGSHTHIGFNAVVAHGCRIGSFVNICPGAVISGEATVGDDVFVGANATIIHGGITIGAGAVIGAGSVVLDHVPAGAVVAGNPGRVIRCGS